MASAWPTFDGISRPVKRRGIFKTCGSWSAIRSTRSMGASRESRNPLRWMLAADLRNQLFDLGQHARHDGVDAGGVRMQAVVLHQAEIAGDAVEKEPIERHAVFGRQRRINA